MTAFHWIERLLKSLTSWPGMARWRQCSLGGASEMQSMQQHDDSAAAIERGST